MDLWQLVSTHYYIGGHLFTKLVISICLSLSLLLFGDVRVKALPLRSRSCQRVVSGICWASRVRVAILWRQSDESSAGGALANLRIVLVV